MDALTSRAPFIGAQDTVADMAKDMRDSRTGSAAASAEELYQFMQKVPCPVPTGPMSAPAQGHAALNAVHTAHLCQWSHCPAYCVHTVCQRLDPGAQASNPESNPKPYTHHCQVRAGEPVDNMDLVKFAQLFNDELTLDNLERVHLVNLCRFIGVTPFGTDDFLRVRLRARLSAIKVNTVNVDTLLYHMYVCC